MFTGIITDIGRVAAVERRGDTRYRLATSHDTAGIAIGASIACSGVCLTVVETGSDWFAVDVSGETLSKTTLGDWREGTRVNLERALGLGDELGGHLVSGHVDGITEIVEIRPDGDSLVFAFALPNWLAPYVAPKGSVALDGVSLTVNGVAEDRFDINVIPHTQGTTTFGEAEVGRKLNVEIDMLARYVRRAMAYASTQEG
jgi:riboflavin synthase